VILLIIFKVWLSKAAKVFNVLPNDNATTVSCPFQPCATLRQYLMNNNGTLPVVSNVEYHFLPGEHHLYTSLRLEHLYNVSLTGLENDKSLPETLISFGSNRSVHFIIRNSQNVTIGTMKFKHYVAGFKEPYMFLFLNVCTSCEINNIIFFQGGLVTHNTFGKFIMKNLIMKNLMLEEQLLTANGFAIVMFYDDEPSTYEYLMNTVEINESSMTGMGGIRVSLDQIKYHVNIVINNSIFYKMTRKVIKIISAVATQVHIENSIFISSYCIDNNLMIAVAVQMVHYIGHVTFLNCKFYQNYFWNFLIFLQAYKTFPNSKNCTSTGIIVFQGCEFKSNKSPIIFIDGSSNNHSCMLNVVIRGPSLISHNFIPPLSETMILFSAANMKLDGPVHVFNNSGVHIIHCIICTLIFAGDISFVSNDCISMIDLLSEMMYIKLLEGSNIVVSRNKYEKNLIVLKPINKGNPYIFCGFQYLNSKNSSTALLTNYNITFTSNHQYIDAHNWCIPNFITSLLIANG